MFVRNEISINKKYIYPCKSSNLYKFLTQHKKIPYVSRVLDSKDNKYIWYFMRTDELSEALVEWKKNKEDGNLIYGTTAKKDNQV
jgi:hypothetical protein